MTWRKANHIHAWFVDNVQYGKDDCGLYEVGWDQLRDLLSLCRKVIKASKLVDGSVLVATVYNKENPEGIPQREPGKVIENAAVAEKLLPTREGFFFGTTEYDEGYLTDVIETRDWIERMLHDRENGVPGYIYYSSSW
ncbi:MAG: hypothetical protein JOZ43_02260 [Acidobacteriales bacterium]|nr:hypothetical protein [Terriglobales bacterium]